LPSWRHNMEVAVDMQTEKVVDELIRHLNEAATRAEAAEPGE